MTSAIYQLPHTDSLDLGYLELRVLLNNLNANRDLKETELLRLVGQTIGVTTIHNMRRKVSAMGVQFDKENKAYYVTADNQILNKVNIPA